MKQLLLLAAIYSLILHQSQKETKQKQTPAVKKTIPNAVMPVVPRQLQVTLRSLSYGNPGFISSIRSNAHAKLSENE
jgi:hypothetical protein